MCFISDNYQLMDNIKPFWGVDQIPEAAYVQSLTAIVGTELQLALVSI